MLLTFIFVCVCVCGFFVSMGRVFLTGGGCVVSCNGTKDKNSIKQIVACVVCYSGSKYGIYFLLLVCIVALGHENNMFLIPARAQKSRRTRFSFYFLF